MLSSKIVLFNEIPRQAVSPGFPGDFTEKVERRFQEFGQQGA